MSTRNISWKVKPTGDQLTTFMCRLTQKSWRPKLLETSGPVRPAQRLLYLPNLRDQTSDCTYMDHNDNFCENSAHSNSQNCASKVRHSVPISPPSVGQYPKVINPAHSLPPYFFTINCNIFINTSSFTFFQAASFF